MFPQMEIMNPESLSFVSGGFVQKHFQPIKMSGNQLIYTLQFRDHINEGGASENRF